MSDNKFPERLSKLIESLGIDQSSFAKKVGLTRAAISQLCSGDRSPSAETLRKIHYATGASLDHLMGIGDEE